MVNVVIIDITYLNRINKLIITRTLFRPFNNVNQEKNGLYL